FFSGGCSKLPSREGISATTSLLECQTGVSRTKGTLVMTPSGELDSRYKVRSPLRCDGVGALHCGEDTSTGNRVAIRWLPLDANGPAAIEMIRSLPDHP